MDPVLEPNPGQPLKPVDPVFTKVPVPPAVRDWANRQVSEDEVAAGLREIRETGGLSLSDFDQELEKAAGPVGDRP